MQDRKELTLRLEKDLWSFLKKDAIDKDMSLNELIVYRLTKYRDRSKSVDNK